VSGILITISIIVTATLFCSTELCFVLIAFWASAGYGADTQFGEKLLAGLCYIYSRTRALRSATVEIKWTCRDIVSGGGKRCRRSI